MIAARQEGEPACLFVYGTLLTRARSVLGADMRRRLHAEGASLGSATIAGRLIDLGDYPGLIDPATPFDRVHGEVFRLDDPDGSLEWLDKYEGIAPQPTPHNEYVRVLTRALLSAEVPVTAWVYRYRGQSADRPIIAGGRWPG